MLASGKRSKEIGKQLSLSVKTVSTYRARIFQKMDMKSIADLTRYAVTQELLA
jgi:DNA-binding CsgD family transcriptional regulator